MLLSIPALGKRRIPVTAAREWALSRPPIEWQHRLASNRTPIDTKAEQAAFESADRGRA